MMRIRPAHPGDFEAMWPIFQRIAAAGDSYVFAADTPRQDAFDYFFAPGVASFVAEADGRIVGFYKLIANRRDRGAHVANASFMVDPGCAGHGVGRGLGRHCLREAKRRGYEAMQFNFVVSTNERAVRLWQSLGFVIVGTQPKAFRHAALGDVDALVMHRWLADVELEEGADDQ